MAKRNKRPRNKYFIILVLGFVLWLAETAYFGFNDKPANGLEATLDVATLLMMGYGFIGDLLRNVRITKSYHTVNTTHIHTKNVEVQGEDQVVHNHYNVKSVVMPKKEV